MIQKLKDWYNKRSNALKDALATGTHTFIGLFGLSLLGWLKDVQEWAGGTNYSFPAVSPLGKAAGSAFAAAMTSMVTLVYRSIQQKKDPTAGPQFPTTVNVTPETAKDAQVVIPPEPKNDPVE